VRKLLLIISLFMGLAITANSQTMNTSVNTRAKFKSLFISKFASSIEWPSAYKQGDFIMAVINDDALAKNLEIMANTKSINSQKVVVKTYTSAADVERCHVIYIAGKTASEVEPYAKKALSYSSLIITEGPGMVDKYSAINFIVSGNLIKYEMNRKLFKDQELVVSNSLEKLATRVVN
jgi:hypothetical protein